MATLQQKKLIKLILENLGSKKNKKTLGELVLDAGYKPSMAKNPYQIFASKTIKEGLKPFVNELEKKRKLAISKLSAGKLTKASARDISYIVDILTKNIQLLSGKETDIVGLTKIEITFKEK